MAGYIMLSFLPLGAADRGFITLGGKLLIISVVIFGTHIAVSYLFGVEEVRPLLDRLKRIIVKPVQVEL